MKKNVGSIDKTTRIALGLVIAIYGVFNSSLIGLIAIIPIGTALINWCPLYPILGLSTCSINDLEEEISE